jgi:hypothetical protein
MKFDSSTELLLKVDGNERKARLFEAENADRERVREILFVDGGVQAGLADIRGSGSRGGGPTGRQKSTSDIAKGLMKIELARYAAGTFAEAYQATSIQLQLPLTTSRPWIEIRPQVDPECRRFRTVCPSSERKEAPAGTLSESKQFKGTVDEFLNALPGFVQRTAQQAGVDPRAYEPILVIVGALLVAKDVAKSRTERRLPLHSAVGGQGRNSTVCDTFLDPL